MDHFNFSSKLTVM